MMMLVYNPIRMSMEMDLMSPFLLRQTAAVSNVHVTVTSLNRVQLDRSAISKVTSVTHRRRRRDATVEFSRVGCVYGIRN